jgi:2-(1,2-epoxy-1,2-dihydrophenyl)acetyl-CoA isomerase
MSSVKRERDGKVGILTLNDPASLNAMTPELLGDLARAIGEMGVERGIRALILTGEGRGFCSGQNLKAFNSLGDNIYTGVMKHYWPAMQALRECQMPVVVAVNGVAAGGGFSLAMSGDIILAARSASFIQVFSRIGLVPDLGSTWLLPRLIGRQRDGICSLAHVAPKTSSAASRACSLVRPVHPATLLKRSAVHLVAPACGRMDLYGMP